MGRGSGLALIRPQVRHFPALTLYLRPSRFLLMGGGIGHLLAGVAVIISTAPLWIKAGLVIGIALALVRFGWRYGNRHSPAFVTGIELLDGRWRLETGDGMRYHAGLTGGYAHSSVVILNFRLE
ncbi:MAG: hypothetical protein HC889_12315, partial [Synechococcaceae cyanobacterium SM1_2_3]|nr:hypothetical protein [Synechococcaceae cyanobacterium SM1_2_3]